MSPNSQFPGDLVTFTEEILQGKFHFLCSVSNKRICEKCNFYLSLFLFLFSIYLTAQNMPEYECCLTYISLFIREYTGQIKSLFWHMLRST